MTGKELELKLQAIAAAYEDDEITRSQALERCAKLQPAIEAYERSYRRRRGWRLFGRGAAHVASIAALGIPWIFFDD